MNSNWSKQIRAALRKELISELRSPHAILTGGFFSIAAVSAISLATFNIRVTPTLAAGLLWVILLFATIGSLPRTFLAEEELGTGDLLRMLGDPHAVYWGKSLFNLLLTLATAILVAALFVLLAGLSVQIFWLFALSLVAGAMAISGAVTLCGALAARASNRQALAAAIAIPLVLPIATWGVSCLRVSLGDGFIESGRLAAIGLLAYGVVSNAIGPYLYAALWKS